MIDVHDKIKDFLIFDSEDDFYYLQILQRKKENPQLGSNSRVIKNYYISNIEYLEKKKEEIVQLCKQFNARAMLRLNKRSHEKVALKTLVNVANSISNKEHSFIKKSYDRACGNGHNDPNKKWILDIDGDYSEAYVNEIIAVMDRSAPEGSKFLAKLPTKNGVHLITKPFDLRQFKHTFPEVDVHKDNPINYIIT